MTGLCVDQVASRLGVKIDTVYAYVSRGVLTARRETGSRRSLFDADEVEALARRGRPRRTTRPAVLDIAVETELTTIADHRVRYRGRDAGKLARSQSFEQVASWLWTGQDGSVGPWKPYEIAVPPELDRPRDRLRAAVVLASAAEPLRGDRSTQAITSCGGALIMTMVHALAAPSGNNLPRLFLQRGIRPMRETVAAHLSVRLAEGRTVSKLVPALNAALVLLADHELASSTLAARVAASVRADVFSVVLAGLGPIAGPMHGSASALVHEMIADSEKRGPSAAVAAAFDRYGLLPGFGHPLYPGGDPRAGVLLSLLRDAAPAAPGLRTANDLIDAASRHSRAEPNVDFALGTLSTVARMPADAGEAIFTIARTAGWIAHAIEEYAEAPVRFRGRTVAKAAGTHFGR